MRGAHGTIGVGANLVIEPPPAQSLAQHRENRIAMRFGELREHRLVEIDLRGEGLRPALLVAQHHGLIATFEQLDAWLRERSDRLLFDLRIECERWRWAGRWRCRHPEPELACDVLVGEPDTEPRACARFGGSALAGPHGRWHPALTRQRSSEISLGRVGQQPKSSIHVRLAGSIAAGDDGQPGHADIELSQRTIAGKRECADHLRSAPCTRRRSP